jgi:hypothetical protein
MWIKYGLQIAQNDANTCYEGCLNPYLAAQPLKIKIK